MDNKKVRLGTSRGITCPSDNKVISYYTIFSKKIQEIKKRCNMNYLKLKELIKKYGANTKIKDIINEIEGCNNE